MINSFSALYISHLFRGGLSLAGYVQPAEGAFGHQYLDFILFCLLVELYIDTGTAYLKVRRN
jgi:hypothetical protein